MAPLSLKIMTADGSVTRTVKFDSSTRVDEALVIVAEKMHTENNGKEYGLFQMSAADPTAGTWLDESRLLEHYMLRDGDSLHYLTRTRALRVRMLDGSIKTVQVDESKQVGELLPQICQKIGVADHDEYGLCQEEMNVEEDSKDVKSSGTLTLKRKPQVRERDAKMEELSKKLRTDDNVEWLDPHKTLREMGVDPKHTLLLKRRLFYSDRKVDSRDPVQLNLLYVQTRNAILEGRHPVTEDQALKFAGLQCQIQHGDYQEDIHKPGLIENLTEYLPVQYANSRSAEKRILKLHKQHLGLTPLEARQLYVKTARDLPTYGVTFFLVKEVHKDKKKLVPRLLGISSEAVLRLDETTKEVLQAWPLTHVLRYRAGGNHTFSLDFGDYSDKQYSVQTHDADRICDILRGYIDLIARKQAAGNYNATDIEGGTLFEDTVQFSRGNEITHVVHGKSKVVEECFIGSNKIMSYEPGKDAQQGTQIMTVQQVIVTNKGSTQQQVVTGEVPMRNDMSLEFVRKLNKINSNSVKIVSLLSDPSEANIKEVQKIIDEMQQLMPDIRTGVIATASKQSTEEEEKKLLQQLDELNHFLNSLSDATQKEDHSLQEIEEAAKNIADLSTQMYFSLDPRTVRRSNLLRRSRKSFMQDEKMEATLRRASLIASAGSATKSVDAAKEILSHEYRGTPLDSSQVQQLEITAVDKLGKINAAVALYLSAYADPSNIDYSTAVTTMNTIHELMPELAKDAHALASIRDTASKEELLKQILDMLEAVRKVSMLMGVDDHKKMQETATEFADVSGKLIYTLGRGNPKFNPDKENEIIDLTKDACDIATVLLMQANSLTEECQSDDGAVDVDRAGVECANAAADLVLTAQLTAPSISEPHCRSALTASVEALSSSSSKLAHAWRPLAQAYAQKLAQQETSAHLVEGLETSTRQLDQALERLRKCLVMFEDENSEANDEGESQERIRFIMSVNTAKDSVKRAEKELDEPIPKDKPNAEKTKEIEKSVAETVAQINAAVASLIQAKSDPQNPDYETIELAMNNISELMPAVIKDTKSLSATCTDERSRAAMLEDIRTWCRAIDSICSGMDGDGQTLNESADNFAKASQKLSFVFSPRANSAKEQLLLELSEAAHLRALQMVSRCDKMADILGGNSGQKLSKCGPVLEGRAHALKKSVQLTASTISSSRCQTVVISSADAVADASRLLVSETCGLQDDETGCRILTEKLDEQRREIESDAAVLEQKLEGIKSVCLKTDDETLTAPKISNVITKREQKELLQKNVEDEMFPKKDEEDNLKKYFTKIVDDTDKLLKSAEENLKTIHSTKSLPLLDPSDKKAVCSRVEDNLARASAAACKLLFARNSETMDYAKASDAARSLSELLPQIVKDTSLLSHEAEENTRKAMLDEIRALCEATRSLCRAASSGAKQVNEAAVRFGDSGLRLRFLVSPRFDPRQEKEVIFQAKQIGEAASRLAQGSATLQVDNTSPIVGQLAVDMASGASTFLYTAKLVAPSIQHPECQTVLTQASEDLSTNLRTLKSALQNSDTIQNSAQLAKLTEEAENLDRLLEGFKKDVDDGKMVVLKEEIIVEETGLRKLTGRIVEHATQMSDTSSRADDKTAYAKYANELTDNIKVLDLTNHNCISAKDLNKYKQLENAVQHLQVTVLQKSPALRGNTHSNIIDLTEFTKALSTEVEKLMQAAHKANNAQNQRAVSDILRHAQRIKDGAYRIINPPENRPEDDSMADILEVDQFGQKCDSDIEAMKALIRSMDDEITKKAFQQRIMSLTEASNLLRFASKSALATAQSVSLDETLNDLEDLEKRVDTLLPLGNDNQVKDIKVNSAPSKETKMSLQSATLALCSGKPLDLPAAVTKYAMECRGQDGAKEHVSKIIGLLTLSCGAASARVAVWEPSGERVKELVKEVFHELQHYPAKDGDIKETAGNIVSDYDVKLLFPTQTLQFEGDERQLEANLQKSANKLSLLASTILASASRPDSLTRTVPSTVEAALHLAQLAKASKNQDPVQSKKIEEISQDMCFATYHLLKSAETVSQDANNSENKRKLFDACRTLNDLIDKLIRKASTAEKLHIDCNELQRRLLSEQNGLQVLRPVCGLPYSDCLEAFSAQEEVVNTLKNDEQMTREEFTKNLSDVAVNVCNTAQFAAHCGYLLSISEQHKELATRGVVDTARIQRLSFAAQDVCLRILRTNQQSQMKHEVEGLNTHLEQLKAVVTEAASRIEGDGSTELKKCVSRIDEAAEGVRAAMRGDFDQVHASTISLLDAITALKSTVERFIPTPSCTKMSNETKALVDEIASNTKNLLSKTQKLVKEVNSSDDSDVMTWVTFGTSRKEVLDAFNKLAASLRNNGQKAGLIADVKSEEADEDAEQKSYVQIQVVMANKWLQKKPLKAEIQKNGVEAVWILIRLAKQLEEDLSGQEREELNHLVSDCEQLVGVCSEKYDHETAMALQDRIRELSKAIERGAVSRVVEDFADAEAPLQDLDTLVEAEKDEAKRKFLLEQKIAELLAQLGRVKRTARFVAAASASSPAASEQLNKRSEQMELLAPQLVQAAQTRINCPQDGVAIEHYRSLLAQYTEAMSRVRDLCDASVDPMDFVQTAGETMQRMREASSQQNDPQKCAFTSVSIQRLANRVIVVGLSSPRVQKEPELQKALKEAQSRLQAPSVRVSRVTDWKDTADEILRTTGEVESALGGEMIFKKQPEPDQPIYNAAHGLHAAVREWSTRDNELVAVAKRVAVLMARLAGYVETDAKRELISTSKAIVSESHEVARLAKKLAGECTDVRIQSNLLQVCERIPTISGQLKMLTTVKASSFGRQGSDEDKEAMNMLICNAQNLMSSVQEVVKAAASASVKILSQRGLRVRWVRRHYY